MAATKTTTLLDLATNFNKYMFGYGISPIAKGFTVGKSNQMYWEILDVTQYGKYPCCGNTIKKFDQNEIVKIHHINNNI